MDAMEERTSSKKIAQGSDEGMGMRANAKAEGKCVKTMVLTRPMRFEREAARIEESAERMPVTKNREPRAAVDRLNFLWKK
jgi:hypothetical protein